MKRRYNKVRKICSIVLSTVLAITICGCGQNTSGEIKTTMKQENQDNNMEENQTELTVWCWDPAFNISAMNAAGELYQTEHTDVTVKVEEVDSSDIVARMSTAIKAGSYEDLPDIILMKDNYLSENLDNYSGMFADLTESGIDYSKFASYKAELGVYEGRNYTVPFDSGAAVMCLRQDIIEQAGYSMADFTDITWSRFIEIGQDIKAKTGYPLLSCQSGSSDFLMMLVQSGGAWLFQNEKPYIADNTVLKEAMMTYKELIDSGILVEENNWDAYTGSINNTEVAGAMNGCWIVSTIMGAEDQAGKWKMTNIPKLDNVPGAVNYSNCGGSSWLVFDTSVNRDTAIDFMKSTFGSSVDLYSTILPISGALATYLPASESEVYNEQVDYFGGEAIYKQISEYTGHVPSIETGIYNATVYDRAGIYLIDYLNGAELNTVLMQFQQEADELYQ